MAMTEFELRVLLAPLPGVEEKIRMGRQIRNEASKQPDNTDFYSEWQRGYRLWKEGVEQFKAMWPEIDLDEVEDLIYDRV